MTPASKNYNGIDRKYVKKTQGKVLDYCLKSISFTIQVLIKDLETLHDANVNLKTLAMSISAT